MRRSIQDPMAFRCGFVTSGHKINDKVAVDGGAELKPCYYLDLEMGVKQRAWVASGGEGMLYPGSEAQERIRKAPRTLQGLPVFAYPDRHHEPVEAWAPDLQLELEKMESVWCFALAGCYSLVRHGASEAARNLLQVLASSEFMDVFSSVEVQAFDGISNVCAGGLAVTSNPSERFALGVALTTAASCGVISGYLAEMPTHHNKESWIKIKKHDAADISKLFGIDAQARAESIF